MEALDRTRLLLDTDQLDSASAGAAVEGVCAAAAAAAAGSDEQLAALEVLEQCSHTNPGAEALSRSQLGCEVLLEAAVRSPKQSVHQLAAVAALANVAAASSGARLAMVRMGFTEVLLSLTSDPELLCTEIQRPTLLALQNLACEPKNLPAMTQAGTLGVAVMLLAAPAFAETDVCVHVLNVILAYTVAGRDALALLLEHGVPISLVHFFMTRKDPQPCKPEGDARTPPRHELDSQQQGREVWLSSQTVTLQILCNLVNDSSASRTHLFECGLPGLVLTVLASDHRPTEHHLWAMRVLAPCVQDPEIFRQLASSDAVEILIDYAARESVQGSEGQLLALDTLARLSSDSTATQLILAKGLPALEALLLHQLLQGSRQQLSVVEAIGWVSSKGTGERLSLIASGVPTAMISLVGKAELAGHPIVSAALVSLNNLSLEEEAGLHMVERGILAALANVIVFDCPGTDSQEKSLGIISALAVQEQPEVQAEFWKSGVIGAVNAVLDHYSSREGGSSPHASELVRLALEVAVNLSAVAGKTAEVMVQHGVVESLMTVATASSQGENRNPNPIENHQVRHCHCRNQPRKGYYITLHFPLTLLATHLHVTLHMSMPSPPLQQLYAIKALKNLSSEPAVAPLLQSKGAQQWLASMERDQPDVMAQLDSALAAMALAESC
jgi:hypothetical protein